MSRTAFQKHKDFMLRVRSFLLFPLHGETNGAMTRSYLSCRACSSIVLSGQGGYGCSVNYRIISALGYTSHARKRGWAFIMSNVWLCKGCHCHISLLCSSFVLLALSWDRLWVVLDRIFLIHFHQYLVQCSIILDGWIDRQMEWVRHGQMNGWMGRWVDEWKGT